MQKIILILSFFALSNFIIGQDENVREFDNSNIKAILVSNISGDITITGNASSSISVEENIGEGNRDFKVRYLEKNDTLYIGVDDEELNIKTKSFPACFYRPIYHETRKQLRVDFNITVPENIIVKVSTVNDGEIQVSNFKNELWAYNINGGIYLTNVKEVRKAHTINGNVDIDFIGNPTLPGRYYTLNGDINVNLLKGLNSDFAFKSFNGDFYTNIEQIQHKPSPIKKIKKRKKGKTTNIEVGNQTLMKVGNGGPLLDFETFNGDAIVKIQK